MDAIRSPSNPLVKRVRAARRGREPGLVLLEGERLCEEALAQGLVPRVLLVGERRPERAALLVARGLDARLVADELLAGLGSLKSAPDVLGLFDAPRARPLAELPDDPDALLLVAAGLQDPGNLGGLARSAEAAGAAALVVLPGGCRPWNEKALRGSMGSLLRLPVFEPEADELCALLARRGARSVLACARGGVAPARVDWSGRVALWIPGETGELPAALARVRDLARVTIPMARGVESLNATVAASLLLFAAGRVEGAR